VETTRIDRWLWAIRLFKTRSTANAACRAGHVRVNGVRVKPASAVRVGDVVEARAHDRERVLDVAVIIDTRVGAPVASTCYVDRSPAPPPREQVGEFGVRDRGAGRPSKRDRRQLDRSRGRHDR
jgi:ribosome-associated heat shock protein Hsp15